METMFFSSSCAFFNAGSYRTYEEWKHTPSFTSPTNAFGFLPYLWGMETNIIRWRISILFKFLPYLWGMETQSHTADRPSKSRGSYRTYEEWKPTQIDETQQQEQGFLPYLWGMETRWSEFRFFVPFLGSYRTSEEWKLCGTRPPLLPQSGSYRTYEEWKRMMRGGLVPAFLLFLPYLWGMETSIV